MDHSQTDERGNVPERVTVMGWHGKRHTGRLWTIELIGPIAIYVLKHQIFTR
jgi:hypothetical protein